MGMGMAAKPDLAASARTADDLMTTHGSLLHMADGGGGGFKGDIKELVAWQVAMAFADATYRATRDYPEEERLGLRLQLRRAAISVVSNIAEGHGRGTSKEYCRFLFIARGSLKEAETQVLLSSRLGFLDDDVREHLLLLIARINRLVRGLLRRFGR